MLLYQDRGLPALNSSRPYAVSKRVLKEVQRALKGLVVMSGELEEMGNSMVNGKVPTMWSKAAYCADIKPLSWCLSSTRVEEMSSK